MIKRAPTTVEVLMLCLLLTFFVWTAFAISDRDQAREQLAEAQKQVETLRMQLAYMHRHPIVIEKEPEKPAEAPKPTVEAPKVESLPYGATCLGSFSVSHYCPCVQCCGKSDGVTASGRQAVPYYSVAVDPSVIPLGTVVWLDYGDGVLHEARADDTGGAVQGRKIDLCVGDHQTAQQYGIRTATVYVGGRQ